MFRNKPRPKKEFKILKIKAFVTKKIRAISEVKVEKFVFKSKFLGFVEAPVGVFITLPNTFNHDMFLSQQLRRMD